MNKVNISHKDLMSVESPGRYVGGEPNQCIKEYVINQLEQNGTCKEVRTAFCFPDIYEIGMSNLAMQILYNVINSEEYNYCERAFTPWHDMIKLMREKNIPLFCVTEPVIKKIADTDNPQGILAVCRMQQVKLESLFASGEMLLVLDRVGDPGNVGTILRTADAAGIGGVVLLEGCVDVYAPKTVRSTMGSLFHIPVFTGAKEELFVKAAKRAGYELLVTSLEGADNLYKANLRGRIAFVMGNEANGVTQSLMAAADKRVYIPMAGRAESLNVAMAAGIVMFEALRRKIR